MQNVGIIAAKFSSQHLSLPGTPLAIYSTLRLLSWGGQCCRVKRSSDSTQLDIGFNASGYIDIASATAFAGAGTLAVVTWYDQSGNALDATSSSNSPTLLAANILNGKQPISIMTQAGGTGAAANLAIPAGLSLSRQSYTAAMAYGAQTGLENSLGFFGLGTDAGATNNTGPLYSNNGATSLGWLDATFHNVGVQNIGQASTLILRSDATNAKMRVNGTEFSASAASALTLTGGSIGKGAWSSAPFGVCEMFALVIYNTTLSPTDCATVESTFASVFNVNLSPTERVVYDGDSITAGFTAIFLRNWTRQAYPSLNNTPAMVDIGVAGQSMQGIYTNRAKAVALFNAGLTKNINHIFAGTNDIETTASGSIVGIGTTIYNNYQLPYIQAMQTAGYQGVVVGTMLPRSWTGSATDISQKETERLAYNSLIASNAAADSYAVADYASLFPTPSVYTTGGGSLDGIHPTVATCTLMAPICATALNTYL